METYLEEKRGLHNSSLMSLVLFVTQRLRREKGADCRQENERSQPRGRGLTLSASVLTTTSEGRDNEEGTAQEKTPKVKSSHTDYRLVNRQTIKRWKESGTTEIGNKAQIERPHERD